VVQNYMTQKASQSCGAQRVEDVEVQMMNKNCKAVQEYIQALEKQKDDKRFPPAKVVNPLKPRTECSHFLSTSGCARVSGEGEKRMTLRE
jgi:hypothetical protein